MFVLDPTKENFLDLIELYHSNLKKTDNKFINIINYHDYNIQEKSLFKCLFKVYLFLFLLVLMK